MLGSRTRGETIDKWKRGRDSRVDRKGRRRRSEEERLIWPARR